MPKRINLKEKAKELRGFLQKYNGLPSLKEDKAAHLNIKYYVKTYPLEPEIKALIDEFLLPEVRMRNNNYESRLAEIVSVLKERKRMPSSSEEKKLYDDIKEFFKKYKDIPEVEKLRYKYAAPYCYPIKESAYERYSDADCRRTASGEWKKWANDESYEYIVYVWKRFGIFPAENTKAMQDVKRKIKIFCQRHGWKLSQDEIEELYSFSKQFEELGCTDNAINSIHHCQEFESEEVQEKVRQMVIENGSCAIKYIADMAIPGISLPVKFVYYYYYDCYYKKNDFWTVRPLGFIYVMEEHLEEQFLRVHYRDYNKCNVESIRTSAKEHYRDWAKNPPTSTEDWKYYGQYGLFVEDHGYTNINKKKLLSEDWSETTITHAFKTTNRYFYMYDRYKYLDYLLFLLENNYTIYRSELTDWLSNRTWYETSPEHSKISQKVNVLLSQKGINLNELKECGAPRLALTQSKGDEIEGISPINLT